MLINQHTDEQNEASNLCGYLTEVKNQHMTGILHITAEIEQEKERVKILILLDGDIVYGGEKVPTNIECIRKIGKKYKPNIIKSALGVALKKSKTSSVRELLEIIVRMRILSWANVEGYIKNQVILNLDELLPYKCKFVLEDANPSSNFDLSFGDDCHGLNVTDVINDLKSRQDKWDSMQSCVTSMDAIPVLPSHVEEKVNNPTVWKHLQENVNGKSSIVEIAHKIGKDPLQIARSYCNWYKSGWVEFPHEIINNANNNSPKSATASAKAITILAVDDSAIVQKSIQKLLGDDYNILTASSALEGLKLLNSNKVDLMLLDVTMPQINGLQMCKKIRSIPKFKRLPIVMLTAKDGFVDKLKGQIAGTTHYLTKPFQKQELTMVVNKYVVQNNG